MTEELDFVLRQFLNYIHVPKYLSPKARRRRENFGSYPFDFYPSLTTQIPKSV